ncbi:SDR family oxidoreductase [Yoonia sp. 2307UL14-13]|uniref:SDR family oxidoreductase n=1 Tax=Yoonia sp. 2307UL14-13 TaxID=3126506 RepID=UPI0030B31613
MIDAAPTDLTCKTCIVTGANGGIGLSIAEHFAALGARVLTTDLGKPDRQVGETHRPFDLMNDLDAACDWVRAEKPDVLVNNAAVFDMGSVLQADLAQYDRLFAVNVRAMFALMQAAGQVMMEMGRGSIINMASQAGHRGEALVAHYCATKAAVISYTQSAALALAPKVRVNAISPGVIETPMWKEVDALFAKFEGKEPGQKKREVGAAVPLGYMGAPSDVARAAVFLASDQSAYITAQTLSVDGGNVLRM